MFRSVQMDLIMGEVLGRLLKLMFHLLCSKIQRKDWKTWQDYVFCCVLQEVYPLQKFVRY